MHPSTLLLLFGFASSRQGRGNGLLLRVAFLYHLADVGGYGFFRLTFFKGHGYSPLSLVLYFLPRQVKVDLPALRAEANAESKLDAPLFLGPTTGLPLIAAAFFIAAERAPLKAEVEPAAAALAREARC